VKYPHAVFEYAIENLVRISDERNNVHSRTLDNARSSPRMRSYVGDDLTNPEFDGGSDRLAKHAAVG